MAPTKKWTNRNASAEPGILSWSFAYISNKLFLLSTSDVDYSLTDLTVVDGLNEEKGPDPGFRLDVLYARY